MSYDRLQGSRTKLFGRKFLIAGALKYVKNVKNSVQHKTKYYPKHLCRTYFRDTTQNIHHKKTQNILQFALHNIP